MSKPNLTALISRVQEVVPSSDEEALRFIYRAVENRLGDLEQAPLVAERSFQVVGSDTVLVGSDVIYCDANLGGFYE